MCPRSPCAPNAPIITAIANRIAAVAVQFINSIILESMMKSLDRMPRTAAYAAVALVLTGLAFAQTPKPAIPKVTFTDTTLDNGLRVIISEDHYAPMYAIVVTYKVGS